MSIETLTCVYMYIHKIILGKIGELSFNLMPLKTICLYIMF